MEKRRSSFKGKVKADSQRHQDEKTSYGYIKLPDGVKMFNPPKTELRVKMDIIPYEVTIENHIDKNESLDIACPGSLWYKRPFYVHKNIGSGTKKTSAVCLETIGQKCPICEYRSKLMKEGGDQDDIKALKPSLRNIYNVIPLDSPDHEKKIHVMDISQAMFQDRLDKDKDEEERYEEFPDLKTGMTLKVRWEPKTIGTGKPFANAGLITFSERPKPYSERILDIVPNLDEILKILSYQELEAKFLEMEGEQDGGDIQETGTSKKKKHEAEADSYYEEEEETSKAPKTSKQKTEKTRKQTEEDDDDGSDEIPTTTRKGKTVAPVTKKEEVDEEEETDEDDERVPDEDEERDEEETDEEEEEADEMTWEDLSVMKVVELKKLIKEYDLDVDASDYDDDPNALRKAVAKAAGIEVPKAAPLKTLKKK